MGKLTVVNPNPVEVNAEFVWDPSNEREVEEAKKVFEEHIGLGFTALRYGRPRTEEIVAFDKDAEEIFMTSTSTLDTLSPGCSCC